ncbi:V8-like Glu-specific endopeptidase [Amycolatopsis marina]|uniref:V8-like Glu-specific endopeptidase n=1 Tax=Amycolatopsis marina TaxID=490629 RepID=A0A1I0YA44_9PSEU|nr:serine protease [Amycolatopsis marina]SFB09390.1 V8-like Glu-specific endopeptidase [Amycolatopsis marina]
MTRRLSGALAAALLATVTTVTPPATASAQEQADYSGIVALSNCSGSIVATSGANSGDPALVLSNGHCLEDGFPAPGEVIVNQPSTRSFTLLSPDGESELGTVSATKLVYATMTGTDVSLYQLDRSYAQITESYGVSARTLADDRTSAGTAIDILSGYWKRSYSCSVDGFVHELREADWVWRDSIRYTSDCKTIGGTSGSPIIDRATGEVVGVNNTGNSSGEECTMNNPCEVDENGEITVRKGINYGQQTHQIDECITRGSAIDLALPECELPEPAALLTGSA